MVPDSHRIQLTRIEHHLEQLEAEATALRQQLKVHRVNDRDKDHELVHKRIKKLLNSITTNLKDIGYSRGEEEEEYKLLFEQQPSSFAIMEEPGTRRRLRARAKKTASNLEDNSS